MNAPVQPHLPRRGRLPATAQALASAGISYEPESGTFTPPHHVRFGVPEIVFDGRWMRADRAAAILMGEAPMRGAQVARNGDPLDLRWANIAPRRRTSNTGHKGISLSSKGYYTVSLRIESLKRVFYIGQTGGLGAALAMQADAQRRWNRYNHFAGTTMPVTEADLIRILRGEA